MRDILNQLYNLISELDQNPDKYTAREIIGKADAPLSEFMETLTDELKKAATDNSTEKLPELIDQVENYSFLMGELITKLKTKTSQTNGKAAGALPF